MLGISDHLEAIECNIPYNSVGNWGLHVADEIKDFLKKVGDYNCVSILIQRK